MSSPSITVGGRLEYNEDRFSRRSPTVLEEFKIMIEFPSALKWMMSDSGGCPDFSLFTVSVLYIVTYYISGTTQHSLAK